MSPILIAFNLKVCPDAQIISIEIGRHTFCHICFSLQQLLATVSPDTRTGWTQRTAPWGWLIQWKMARSNASVKLSVEVPKLYKALIPSLTLLMSMCKRWWHLGVSDLFLSRLLRFPRKFICFSSRLQTRQAPRGKWPSLGRGGRRSIPC